MATHNLMGGTSHNHSFPSPSPTSLLEGLGETRVVSAEERSAARRVMLMRLGERIKANEEQNSGGEEISISPSGPPRTRKKRRRRSRRRHSASTGTGTGGTNTDSEVPNLSRPNGALSPEAIPDPPPSRHEAPSQNIASQIQRLEGDSPERPSRSLERTLSHRKSIVFENIYIPGETRPLLTRPLPALPDVPSTSQRLRRPVVDLRARRISDTSRRTPPRVGSLDLFPTPSLLKERPFDDEDGEQVLFQTENYQRMVQFRDTYDRAVSWVEEPVSVQTAIHDGESPLSTILSKGEFPPQVHDNTFPQASADTDSVIESSCDEDEGQGLFHVDDRQSHDAYNQAISWMEEPDPMLPIHDDSSPLSSISSRGGFPPRAYDNVLPQDVPSSPSSVALSDNASITRTSDGSTSPQMYPTHLSVASRIRSERSSPITDFGDWGDSPAFVESNSKRNADVGSPRVWVKVKNTLARSFSQSRSNSSLMRDRRDYSGSNIGHGSGTSLASAKVDRGEPSTSIFAHQQVQHSRTQSPSVKKTFIRRPSATGGQSLDNANESAIGFETSSVTQSCVPLSSSLYSVAAMFASASVLSFVSSITPSDDPTSLQMYPTVTSRIQSERLPLDMEFGDGDKSRVVVPRSNSKPNASVGSTSMWGKVKRAFTSTANSQLRAKESVIESDTSPEVTQSRVPPLPHPISVASRAQSERSPLGTDFGDGDKSHAVVLGFNPKYYANRGPTTAWGKVKSTFTKRATINGVRLPSSNSIPMHERQENTDSMIINRKGNTSSTRAEVEKKVSTGKLVHQQVRWPIMRYPSASSSILSSTSRSVSLIPTTSPADFQYRLDNDKLVPFPGMKKLEEQRNRAIRSRILRRERRANTDPSISRASSTSAELSFNRFVYRQGQQPLMQSPSASSSILSLPSQLASRGSVSSITAASPVDLNHQHDKLFPFPGIMKLEEWHRRRRMTSSVSTPAVALFTAVDDRNVSGSSSSGSPAYTPEMRRSRKLSQQASDDRLLDKFSYPPPPLSAAPSMFHLDHFNVAPKTPPHTTGSLKLNMNGEGVKKLPSVRIISQISALPPASHSTAMDVRPTTPANAGKRPSLSDLIHGQQVNDWEEMKSETSPALSSASGGTYPGSRYTRLSDVPDITNYLQAVKAQFSDDPPTYRRFLNLIYTWRNDSSMSNIDKLIEGVSILLRNTPGLLRDFNALLLNHDYRIECATHTDKVNLITVVTSSGAQVRIIPGNQSLPPSIPVANTEELRQIFSSSEDGWKNLAELKSDWASCMQELLQSELDREELTDGRYKRKLVRCLRQLARNSGELPPSLFLRNVVREGDHPVRGGGYADIWKGCLNKKAVCLKVLRVFVSDHVRHDILKSFCNEALVWRQLHHPNILPFYGVSKSLFPTSLCLISPWMDNGHIMNYLDMHPDHNRLASIMEIAEGLQYLHEFTPSIIHGDIKGANILVSDDLRCCLGDFGLVTVVETQTIARDATTSGSAQGTMRWMAPELMDPSQFSGCSSCPTIASDIFSFGCTSIEILTGKPPFSHHRNEIAVMNDILKGVRPHRPELACCPDNIWKIIESCWAHQPHNRPSIDCIVYQLTSQSAAGGSSV